MVTIELPDSVAAALTAQAEARGLQLHEYLERMAEFAQVTSEPSRTDYDFEQELDALSLNVPPLPADFSRADIYQGHD